MSRTSIDPSLISSLASLLKYRRPNLVWSSNTAVLTELGLDGTSGDATILFPDGQFRTETGSGRYTMTISQNAVFNNATLGSNQGGLRTGSAAANTWYACYAVKVTTFSANWVLVADTVLPIQANYSTLNSNFGTNGWVYLGMIRYGDQSANTTAILNFQQQGNSTYFLNVPGSGSPSGIEFASNGSATSLTYSTSAGTSGLTIPNNLTTLVWVGQVFIGVASNVNGFLQPLNSSVLLHASQVPSNGDWSAQGIIAASAGARVTSSVTASMALWLGGFFDNVLGVSGNSIL